MKWQLALVDKTASWWNRMLHKRQIDEGQFGSTVSWWNLKLMKKKVTDEMASWLNYTLMKCQVYESESCISSKLMKWQFG